MHSSSAALPRKPFLHPTQHQAALQAWIDAKNGENLLIRENARRLRASQDLALVLVVDDETIVAITLAEILRRKGFNAVWFNRSTEALAYVQDGPVDLMLTDITMPDLDGVDLVMKVYDLVPTCKFLLFSALSDCQNTIDRVGTLVPKVHVEAKPLAVEKLVSTLAVLLERSGNATSVDPILETSALSRS